MNNSAASTLGRMGGFALVYGVNLSTSAPPAAGEIRYNNASLASVTSVFISKTDGNGVNETSILSMLAAGSLFMIFEQASPNFASFEVTTLVDNGAYYTINVIYLSSLGVPHAAAVGFSVAGSGGGSGTPGGSNGQFQFNNSGVLGGASGLNYNVGTGKVSVGSTTFTSLFNVGSTTPAGFQVDVNGNLVAINNVAYSWPVVHGVNGAVLTTDTSGNLSWGTAGGVPDATTSTPGVVQLATQSQAWQGTPDTVSSNPIVIQPSGTLLRRDSTGNTGLFTVTNDVIVANARGQFALDIQTNRSAVTQVAAGFSSIAIGYRNTTALLNAANEAEIAIGISNTVGGYNGMAFGQNNVIATQSTDVAPNDGNKLFGVGNTTIVAALRVLGVGSANVNLARDNYVFGHNNDLNSTVTCGVFGASNIFTSGASGIIYVFGQTNTISATAQLQSVTIGFGNTFGGYDSYTIGTSNVNNGTFNVCLGRSNTINGSNTSGQNVGVLGSLNTTITNVSNVYVIGVNNSNVTTNSLVVGINQDLNSTTTALVFGSGNSFTSGADTPVVFGSSNVFGASSSNAMVFGQSNTSSASHTMIYGTVNNCVSPYSIVFGYGNTTNSSGSNFNTCIGTANTTAVGASNAQAFGASNSNVGSNSVVFGYNNVCNSNGNVILYGTSNTATSGAIGFAATFGYANVLGASANQAAAFGNSNTVNSLNAHAFGVANVSNGSYGFCFGYGNTVNSTGSNFVFLYGASNTSAVGAASTFAIGTNNTLLGTNCFIIGPGSNINGGSNLIVIGTGTPATPTQNSANTVLIGVNNSAGANVSQGIAIGNNNTVNNLNTFIIGTSCTINSAYAVAIGYNNTIGTFGGNSFSAIVGHSNNIVIGSTTTSVLGFNNTDVGTASAVVGINNVVNSIASVYIFGNANNLTTGSSALLIVGMSNSMTANATTSNVFGRLNTIDSTTSTIVGVSNTTEANCTNANVHGTNNALHGTATIDATVMGMNNILGTNAVSGGAHGTIYGFNNNVQADDGISLGINGIVASTGTQAAAIGYGAQVRVPNTINFGGLPIIRHDGGELAGTELKNYTGMKVVIMSKRLNFNSPQSVSLTVPTGAYVMIEEVGAIYEAIGTGGVNITLNFGIASAHTKYLSGGVTQRLDQTSTSPRRDRFVTLGEDEGETDLFGQIVSSTTQDIFGRLYWVVTVIEA